MMKKSRLLWSALLLQACCFSSLSAAGTEGSAIADDTEITASGADGIAVAAENSLWVHPNVNWQTLGAPNGTLLIAGGANNDTVYQAFLDLVGDQDALIVFISTANDTLDERNKAYRELIKNGARNLVILHTSDRREADSDAFVEPLTRAKAVYISGGHQKRLAQSYLHTKTHDALLDLLERGGVIGGSSAGASIQGEYLVGGGIDQREGLGFVKDSAIGQHYFRRKRMGSVGKIISENEGLYGIAIDEATAIILRGNEFEVVGDSKVGIYDTKAKNWDAAQPQVYLFAGDRYNLATREVTLRAKAMPETARDGESQPWLSPADDWQSIGPQKGQLILYGGEADASVYADFITAAGGADALIVVLSSGNDKLEDNANVAEALVKEGAQNVQLLHTINRAEANSADFNRALESAQAVWVCDGPLWRYAESYEQTLTHRLLFGVLERGGVVAGSGKGAGVLASRLFEAGYKWTDGYGLLQHAMVFSEPLKSKQLKSIGKIMQKDHALVGIGLSNGAWVIVSGNGLSVGGNGEVRVYRSLESGELEEPLVLAAGSIFKFGDVAGAAADTD